MKVTHFKTLIGHQSPIYHIQIISQDTLLSCDGNGFIIKWNIKSGEGDLFAKCAKSVYVFTKIENELIIGDILGFIHIIDYNKKTLLKKIQISTKEIFSISYSEIYRQFFIADGEGKLTVLDSNFEQIHQLQLSNSRLRSISNNNQSLYIGSSDGFVYKYSIPDHQLTNSYPLHLSSIFSTLHIENTLISAGRDAKIIAFNTENESVINTVDAHLNTINQLSFTQCKKYLLTASRDKSLKVWCAKSLQLLKVINTKKFPNQIQRSLNTVTSHKNFIVTGGDDKKIVIWQAN